MSAFLEKANLHRHRVNSSCNKHPKTNPAKVGRPQAHRASQKRPLQNCNSPHTHRDTPEQVDLHAPRVHFKKRVPRGSRAPLSRVEGFTAPPPPTAEAGDSGASVARGEGGRLCERCERFLKPSPPPAGVFAWKGRGGGGPEAALTPPGAFPITSTLLPRGHKRRLILLDTASDPESP